MLVQDFAVRVEASVPLREAAEVQSDLSQWERMAAKTMLALRKAEVARAERAEEQARNSASLAMHAEVARRSRAERASRAG